MGPLLSLVFRTEDVWQRYNQLPKRFGALNQGFPFSPLQCRQGRARMGGRGCKCTLRAGVVLCIVFVTMLPDTVDDSSTSTRCLYFRSSQLCLIKRIRNFKRLWYILCYGLEALLNLSITSP